MQKLMTFIMWYPHHSGFLDYSEENRMCETEIVKFISIFAKECQSGTLVTTPTPQGSVWEAFIL